MSPRVILNFHGLGPPHDGVPAEERPYWLTETRFAAIAADVAARQGRGQEITLTFDDGNRSDLDIAVPVLADHGLTAEIFVLTGRLDDPRYLSRAAIGDCMAAGMAIGLHGRDHIDWRRADDATLMAETHAARETLAAITGTPIASVGIPFGGYNRRVMARLRSEGFARIYTSDGGPAAASARIQPRNTLRNDTSEAALAAILDGQEPLATTLKRRARRALKTHLI